MDFEQLVAWKVKKWMPWTGTWYPAKPATPESIARIEQELKFKLHPDFIRLSQLALNYGVWFGSIGDDYTSHNHLLILNEVFHQDYEDSIALPEHWVLINHGHDGDYDCFDISAGADGEYPIWYMDIECARKPIPWAKTFREYLEHRC